MMKSPKTLNKAVIGIFLILMGLSWGTTEHSLAAKTSTGVRLPPGYHYPPEHIYNNLPHSDESLVNVQIASNRWPDCHTFETAIQSIFIIEGVSDKSDEEKALALWKWMRILMNPTGYKYAYEGEGPEKERVVFDGHKILTVYGHHQCDGLSWVMVPLWRAAGYMAFDEASHRHTTASLRYKDHDGIYRYHSFDLRKKFLWWNSQENIVGTRTQPLMKGTVFRHLTLGQKVHSLRTSLHLNESLERRWENTGQVIPYGRHPSDIKFNDFFKYRKGRQDGVYASVGMEIQKFSPGLSPETYQKDLYKPLSRNLKSNPLKNESPAFLYPENSAQQAEAVYRIQSPYAAANATLEMAYRLSNKNDRLALYISRNGKTWKKVYVAGKTGEHHVKIDLGRKKREAGKPNLYTAYTFFIKVKMQAAKRVLDVGIKDLSVEVLRTLNKRTLPNLMPGENVFKVTADGIAPGKALHLSIDYTVKEKPFFENHLISSFPYYFKVYIKDTAAEIRNNYDTIFGRGDIRMKALKIRLADAPELASMSGSAFSVDQGERLFKKAHAHPSKDGLIIKKKMDSSAIITTKPDGFFPQQGHRPYQGNNKEDYIGKLKKQLRKGKDWDPKTWRAAEELGNFPEALDALLEELPSADIDLTLFICKALARIKAPESIGPLLKKWELAPKGAPGTRYIPDVLAAIGDPKVVPHLIQKLKSVRFDFRFHIARALGILGGDDAEKTLQDLSLNDPFPAVRQMAKKSLSNLHANPK